MPAGDVVVGGFLATVAGVATAAASAQLTRRQMRVDGIDLAAVELIAVGQSALAVFGQARTAMERVDSPGARATVAATLSGIAERANHAHARLRVAGAPEDLQIAADALTAGLRAGTVPQWEAQNWDERIRSLYVELGELENLVKERDARRSDRRATRWKPWRRLRRS